MITTMKITKARLKQLIREELNEIDSDDFRAMQADTSMSGQAPMSHMEINKLVDEAAERIIMEVEKLSEIIGRDRAVSALTKAIAEFAYGSTTKSLNAKG